MVLEILGPIAGATGVTLSTVSLPQSATATSTSTVGVAQGAMNDQEKGGRNRDYDPRLEKFTLKTHCDQDVLNNRQVHRRVVVLRKGKLYLDSPSHPRYKDGHHFSGFFVDYSSSGRPRGLVSTIHKEHPELNWIYVDKETLELRYGCRSESIGNIVGPWGWMEHRNGLILGGWEGFVVMQEEEGEWVLSYDWDGNCLRRVRGERRMLEVELDHRLLSQLE